MFLKRNFKKIYSIQHALDLNEDLLYYMLINLYDKLNYQNLRVIKCIKIL